MPILTERQTFSAKVSRTFTTVYEPHFYSNQEIKDLPIQILGKVVEVRYKP